MEEDDDLIRKNPLEFQLAAVLYKYEDMARRQVTGACFLQSKAPSDCFDYLVVLYRFPI